MRRGSLAGGVIRRVNHPAAAGGAESGVALCVIQGEPGRATNDVSHSLSRQLQLKCFIYLTLKLVLQTEKRCLCIVQRAVKGPPKMIHTQVISFMVGASDQWVKGSKNPVTESVRNRNPSLGG